MDMFLTVLSYLLPVIFSILTILATAATKHLLTKWGVDRSQKIDRMIDDYVEKGVQYAEVSARKYLNEKGSSMPSDDKRLKAVRVVMDELEQSGLTGVAEELITARIESYLEGNGHEPGVKSPLV